MIFLSKKTSQLNRDEFLKILILKEEEWKHGISSQKKFFKKNVKKFDIHNLFFKSNKKKKLIGYTCFRVRHFMLNKKKMKYMLLDSIIVSKDYKKKNYGKKIMKINNIFIKKNRLPSFLFCTKKKSNFFKLFKWKLFPSKKFQIAYRVKKKQNLMYYNSNLMIKNINIISLTI